MRRCASGCITATLAPARSDVAASPPAVPPPADERFRDPPWSPAGSSVPGNGPVLKVACTDSHTCAIEIGGPIRCFGSNEPGQLGDGTKVDDSHAVDAIW